MSHCAPRFPESTGGHSLSISEIFLLHPDISIRAHVAHVPQAGRSCAVHALCSRTPPVCALPEWLFGEINRKRKRVLCRRNRNPRSACALYLRVFLNMKRSFLRTSPKVFSPLFFNFLFTTHFCTFGNVRAMGLLFFHQKGRKELYDGQTTQGTGTVPSGAKRLGKRLQGPSRIPPGAKPRPIWNFLK